MYLILILIMMVAICSEPPHTMAQMREVRHKCVEMGFSLTADISVHIETGSNR